MNNILRGKEMGGVNKMNDSDSTKIVSTNIQVLLGSSPEYLDLVDRLSMYEKLLERIPENDAAERSRTTAKLSVLKENIERYKSDVIKLAESFSQIEVNTERLKRAKEHFDRGEITEARVTLEDALEEITDEKQNLLIKKREFEDEIGPKLRIKADEYLILAQTTAANYENPNRIDDAIRYFEDSIDCYVTFENVFVYGNFLWESGKFQLALNYIERALKIAMDAANQEEERNIFNWLGNAYLYLGEYKKSIEFYEFALAKAREIGDELSTGKLLGNLGNAYFSLGNYERAVSLHSHALDLSRKLGDRLSEGNNLGNLGTAYYSMGEYKMAIALHKEALKIAQEINDVKGEGNSIGNLGLAYNAIGEYAKAIEFQERSLNIKRVAGNKLGEGNSLGNLGLSYNAIGEYKKSIEFQEQALEISKEINDRLGEGNSLANLGVSYQQMGDSDKACELWTESFTILNSLGSPQAEKVRQWLKEANHDPVEIEKSKSTIGLDVGLSPRNRDEEYLVGLGIVKGSARSGITKGQETD